MTTQPGLMHALAVVGALEIRYPFSSCKLFQSN